MKGSEISRVQTKQGYILEVRHGEMLWEVKRKVWLDVDDNDFFLFFFWWVWEDGKSENMIPLLSIKKWYDIELCLSIEMH